MPLYPSTEPSIDSFGPILDLDQISQDDTRQGPAPWAKRDPRNPSVAQKIDSSDPQNFNQISPLLIGGGAFGQGMYNENQLLFSEMPTRGQ